MIFLTLTLKKSLYNRNKISWILPVYATSIQACAQSSPPWLPWGHFLWKLRKMPKSKVAAAPFSHRPGFTWAESPPANNLCVLVTAWQLCGKEFNRMHNLMGHMHLHSDSKPFKCLYCPSKFTLKGNLTRHMKVKHGVMERGLHSQGNHSSRKPPRLSSPVGNKGEVTLFLGALLWGLIFTVEIKEWNSQDHSRVAEAGRQCYWNKYCYNAEIWRDEVNVSSRK